MAYKQNFNPDALPAHAEPDQAAQLIASSQRPPQKPNADYNKPTQAPPARQQQQQGGQSNYRRPSNPQSPVYSTPDYSGSGYGPPIQGRDPRHDPRHDPRQGQGRPGGGPAPGGYSGGFAPSPVPGSQGYGAPSRSATSPRPPGSFPQNGGGYGPAPAPRHDSLPGPHSGGSGGGGGGAGGAGYYNSSPHGQNAHPSRTSPQVNHAPFHSPQPGPAPGPAGTQHIPPAGGDNSLFSLFRAVDTAGTGQLGEEQLGKALRNGDYTSFDPMTVRLMIRMFDHNRNGTVGFEEFQGLWGFLAAWRELFDKFDEDKSGHISYTEFQKALSAFGYHLSEGFVTTVYRMHDKPGPNRMSFDLFVQACISLKRMTDVFKKYDTDRDGYITLSFEDFLTEILNQRT